MSTTLNAVSVLAILVAVPGCAEREAPSDATAQSDPFPATTVGTSASPTRRSDRAIGTSITSRGPAKPRTLGVPASSSHIAGRIFAREDARRRGP
jgi:hypothetical protein